MLMECKGSVLTVWAPAKVNLFLEVLAKRPDGYHDVATLMVAVSLYDALEFKEDHSGRVALTCDRDGLSTGRDNLVMRAAELLRRRKRCKAGAAIHLRKRIPMAAGLAGGSTDAAAALTGLNRLWRLDVPRQELIEIAAEIGSDVAFFFATPAAWCTGRGEKIEPVTLGRPLYFVLVCPRVGLSTAEVYRNVVVPKRPIMGRTIRQAFAQGKIDELGRRLHNRLQPAAEKLCPIVARVREKLTDLNPLGHLMSGSGSASLALCRNRAEAQRMARELAAFFGVEDGISLFIVRSSI